MITSIDMTTTDQILKILYNQPFSRFPMSQLKSHLPATLSREAEIDDAMVELYQGGEKGIVGDGEHRLDGGVDVRWVSYYGD